MAPIHANLEFLNFLGRDINAVTRMELVPEGPLPAQFRVLGMIVNHLPTAESVGVGKADHGITLSNLHEMTGVVLRIAHDYPAWVLQPSNRYCGQIGRAF